MGDFTGALLRLLVGLPLVAGLAYLSLKYGLGRRTVAANGSYLRVMEQVSLSPHARVSVIKAGEKYLLLGSNEGGVSLLLELADYHGRQSDPALVTWFRAGHAPFDKGVEKP